MFYRIDGIADGRYGDLTARRFTTLALKCFDYQGAVAARAAELAREEQKQPVAAAPAATTTAQSPRTVKADEVVDSDPHTLTTHPAFLGIIEYKRG